MTVAPGWLRAYFDRYKTGLLLLLIVVLAGALRFVGLTFQSYGFDELSAAWYSNPVLSYADVIELTRADMRAALHPLAIWWSYSALGYSEFAGRFPSALAGVLTIPVIFLLGRELFDARTGFYAAAFATPNYYLVYFSQQASATALLGFLTCLSFLFFLRLLRRLNWPNVLLYVVATAALACTHHLAFTVIAIQVSLFLLYWWLWSSRDRLLLIRATVASLLLAAALLVVLAPAGQPDDFANTRMAQPPPGMAAGFWIGYFQSVSLAICSAVLIAGGVLVMGVRALREQRYSWASFSVLALVLWIALGYLLPWLQGVVTNSIPEERDAIILLPPLLLLVALGVHSLPWPLLERTVGAVMLVLGFYTLSFATHYYTAVRTSQYREITKALADYQPTLPLYATPQQALPYNVYFEQSGSPLRVSRLQILETQFEAGTSPALFWYVRGHEADNTTALPSLSAWVQVASYAYFGVTAELLLDPRSARQVALEKSVLTSSGTNWLSAEPFTWQREDVQLLLVLNKSARKDPVRKVQVDLLDVQGHVRESHTASLGAVPSTLQITPELAAGEQARLVVRMPADEPEPEVWVIKTGSGTR